MEGLEKLDERCRNHPVLGPLADRLRADGTPLFIVGGPVRDAVSGVSPDDLDVATAADPCKVAEAATGLGTLNLVGESFGVVKIHADGDDIDVATFRTDVYEPGDRRPTVALVGDIVADLERRDFTINAMAIEIGSRLELIDPFGGVSDLDARRLRTPGDPHVSFTDDPLRIHRAWRFAATRNLELDASLFDAAAQAAHALGEVSRERKTIELSKVLDHRDPAVFVRALEQMGRLGVTDDVLPGVSLDPADAGEIPARRLDRLAALASTTPDAGRFLDLLLLPSNDTQAVRTVLQTTQRLCDGPDDLQVRALVRNLADDTLDAATAACRRAGVTTDRIDTVRSDAALWRRDTPISGADVLAIDTRPPGRWVGEVLTVIEQWMLTDEAASLEAAALEAAATRQLEAAVSATQ